MAYEIFGRYFTDTGGLGLTASEAVTVKTRSTHKDNSISFADDSPYIAAGYSDQGIDFDSDNLDYLAITPGRDGVDKFTLETFQGVPFLLPPGSADGKTYELVITLTDKDPAIRGAQQKHTFGVGEATLGKTGNWSFPHFDTIGGNALRKNYFIDRDPPYARGDRGYPTDEEGGNFNNNVIRIPLTQDYNPNGDTIETIGVFYLKQSDEPSEGIDTLHFPTRGSDLVTYIYQDGEVATSPEQVAFNYYIVETGTDVPIEEYYDNNLGVNGGWENAYGGRFRIVRENITPPTGTENKIPATPIASTNLYRQPEKVYQSDGTYTHSSLGIEINISLPDNGFLGHDPATDDRYKLEYIWRIERQEGGSRLMTITGGLKKVNENYQIYARVFDADQGGLGLGNYTSTITLYLVYTDENGDSYSSETTVLRDSFTVTERTVSGPPATSGPPPTDGPPGPGPTTFDGGFQITPLKGASDCGPGEGLRDLADKLAAVEASTDALLEEATGGIGDLLDSIGSIVANEVNKVKGSLESMIPESFRGAAKTFEDGVKEGLELAAVVAAGGEAAINAAIKLRSLARKWEGIIDNLGGLVDNDGNPIETFYDVITLMQTLLRTGATDLDSLCKMLPNVSESYDGTVSVKATPITIPEFDAVDLIKGYELPELPTPTLVIDVSAKKLETAASFTNFQAPKLYGGPKG